MFSKTAVCAMLGTLALVSSAALPAQAATAPSKRKDALVTRLYPGTDAQFSENNLL